MTPYKRMERIGDAVLYLGDCLQIMPTLDPVDHIISDPPYEQISQDRIGGIKRNDGGRVTEKLTFAGIDEIRARFLTAVNGKSAGWLLVFCTSEGVALWRDAIEAERFKYKTPMVWVKPDAMPKFNGQGPALGHENIVSAWLGNGHARWQGGGKRGVYTCNTNQPDRHGGHPTEKPWKLFSELLVDFSKPGDTILDPFMGSGTTGVACAKLGRKFIGIELEEKYFDIACERIQKAYDQPDLFIAPPEKPKQEALL